MLLTTEIESMKIRRDKYEKKYKDLMKIMVSLKVSIPIMFERIGCNQDEYMIMLGENFVILDIYIIRASKILMKMV